MFDIRCMRHVPGPTSNFENFCQSGMILNFYDMCINVPINPVYKYWLYILSSFENFLSLYIEPIILIVNNFSSPNSYI